MRSRNCSMQSQLFQRLLSSRGTPRDLADSTRHADASEYLSMTHVAFHAICSVAILVAIALQGAASAQPTPATQPVALAQATTKPTTIIASTGCEIGRAHV